jgi:hypothetical protein
MEATMTGTRPSWSTQLERALEQFLEAPAYLTICSRSPAHTTRHRSTTPSSSVICSKNNIAAPP